MPQSSSPNSAPKMQAGSVLRPPPGFNSANAPLNANIPIVHSASMLNVHNANMPHVHNANMPHVHNANMPHVHNANMPHVHNANMPHVHNVNMPHVHNANMPNVHHMSAPSHLGNTGMPSTQHNNFETMRQPYIGDRSYNGNHMNDSNIPTLMPFPHSYQPSGRHDPYPFPSDVHSNAAQPHIIPQTNNPFAYPMPPLGSSNNRFQGLNVPSHLPNSLVLNPAPLMDRTNEVPNYLGANLTDNLTHTNETSTDLNMELGNDLFGLRSLGLFDDNTVTKNPFAYK